MSSSTPDRKLLESAISPEVVRALDLASAALSRAGVRHLVVGGLAVAAHGYLRSTKDVDFLVGEEAFEHHEGGLVTMRAGVPIQVGGVIVDFLSIGKDEAFLESELSKDGAIASSSVLTYLKLKSPRTKDRADLVELVKAGLDVTVVRAFLAAHQPLFVAKLDEIVRTADAEG
ncbi:hypothetical protein BH09MYX1_BH09MYX1_47160 [soil metagenome]